MKLNDGNIKIVGKKFAETYSACYKELLDILFSESFVTNPEAFPFNNLFKLDLYIVKGNNKILNNEFYMFVYLGNGKVEYLGEIPQKKYEGYKDYNSELEFLKEYIISKTENKNYYSFISLDSYNNSLGNYSLEKYLDNIRGNIYITVKSKLMEDGNKFLKHINKPTSYYARNAFKYVYTDLDFSGIMKMVNDADFEYALNESIACYDNSLYLAAVSTAGTALENLILRILEVKGEEIDNLEKISEKTELGELSGILKKRRIINRRDRNRILMAASARNSASHANKGRVVREDARLIYQEIFNLAEQIFGKD